MLFSTRLSFDELMTLRTIRCDFSKHEFLFHAPEEIVSHCQAVCVRRPTPCPSMLQRMLVHYVGRLRCLHEHAAQNGADVFDDVACDTRVSVVPVEPDSASSLNALNSIAPNQSPAVYQELHACYLPVEPASCQPQSAMKLPDKCMLIGETAFRCSAVMYEIAPHDCMAEVGILPFHKTPVRTFEDVEPTLYPRS